MSFATIPARDLPTLGYAHSASHNPALTAPAAFRPVAGAGWVKPESGGLWTSPVTGGDPDGPEPVTTSWLDWCRENMPLDACRVTQIVPGQDARVLLVDSQDHLRSLVDAFPASWPVLPDRVYPDWVALAAAWDAVYLTDRGLDATHLPRGGPDLYSWDVASVFWLRPAYSVGWTVSVPAMDMDAEVSA